MAQQTINVGAAPNDGTGTPLRTAFQYTNSNFSELYTAVGPSGNNIVVPGNATITGDLTVDTSTLKVDSANNRVGIGTATPSDTLSIIGGNASNLLIDNGGEQYTQLTLQRNSVLNSGGDILINGTASTMNIRMLAVGSMKLYTSPTAGSPAERYSIDSTGISTWSVAGSTAMTLNSTGLGVGMSPSAILSVLKSSATQATGLILRNASGADGCSISLDFEASAGTSGSEGSLAGRISGRRVGGGTTGALDFFVTNAGTLGSAKMVLDASGNLLVGTTTTNWGTDTGIYGFASGALNITRNGGECSTMNRLTSDGQILRFYRSNALVGAVSVTTTGTTYDTSSDYRLKESVQPLSGGLARVNALKPSVYKWKIDGSTGEGFIAHELAEVVPLAVNGQKDAVNEDGSIKAQGIDMSRVVPILVAAIQELAAEVNALKNA